MFRQEILHTSKCKQYSQQKIIKWTRREFKGDKTYYNKWHCARRWLLAEEQRGYYGQIELVSHSAIIWAW